MTAAASVSSPPSPAAPAKPTCRLLRYTPAPMRSLFISFFTAAVLLSAAALRAESWTLDRAVASAREAERLASLSYRSGQVDLLQVLDAQRTLLSLEEQDTIARGNLANAHIQLCKALGGGGQS